MHRRAGSGIAWAAACSLAILVLACGQEPHEPGAEALSGALSADDMDSVPGLQGESAASGASTKITIPTRVFSSSPSLGGKTTSISERDSPNYGALAIFFEKVARYTGRRVAFEIASWSPDATNTVIQQVGINGDPNASGVARDAAYDSGLALNPVWGFLYNSIPFGPDFDKMLRFLDEGGLDLAQTLVDARGLNVKLLPVVGSNPQGSGYFKHPIGTAGCDGEDDCLRDRPIGLAGLCQAGWTWRYYAPAQEAINRACQQLVNEGIIPAVKLTVGKLVPGQSTLADVQQGSLTAFEYATPIDDYDSPPSGTGYFTPSASKPIPLAAQNPGHKGLRFAHFPSWHQGYYLGWMMINKSALWDRLPRQFQVAVERAAREAVEESYWNSKSLQCAALKKILDFNDGQVQLDNDGRPVLVDGRPVSADIKLAEWPEEALTRLKSASEAYLESLQGGAEPSADQRELSLVLSAFRAHIKKIKYTWNPKDFGYSADCHL